MIIQIVTDVPRPYVLQYGARYTILSDNRTGSWDQWWEVLSDIPKLSLPICTLGNWCPRPNGIPPSVDVGDTIIVEVAPFIHVLGDADRRWLVEYGQNYKFETNGGVVTNGCRMLCPLCFGAN